MRGISDEVTDRISASLPGDAAERRAAGMSGNAAVRRPAGMSENAAECRTVGVPEEMMPAWSTFFRIREQQPVIHCITNYVTANDVANMMLAAGASPIMADGPGEAAEIAEASHGLVLNLGTLKESAVEAMMTAGRRAAELAHPIVLDPVGAGAIALRRETALKILAEIPVTVIRGNASEIRALAGEHGYSRGVDADQREALTRENRQETTTMVRQLSKQTGAVVVMTGAVDVVADRDRVCFIKNGSPMMGQITGAGCMLDGVLAAALVAAQMTAAPAAVSQEEQAAEGAVAEQTVAAQAAPAAFPRLSADGTRSADWFRQAVQAVAAVGICGEMAEEKTRETGGGSGSFRTHFIDAMSRLTDEDIQSQIRVEQDFDLRVYAVTDQAWTGEQTLLEQLETALEAGVTLVQLREKDLDDEAFLREAIQMKALTDRYGVPLIVNDNVSVAIACGAAGVHVGQEDLETGQVRRLLGPDKIIGVTAKTVDQAKRAQAAGADYLGSGAVFGSSTKLDAKPMTMERLKEITSAVSIPVVAIGGIHGENAGQLAGTGVAGVAVVSGIFGEKDIAAAVHSLRDAVEQEIVVSDVGGKAGTCSCAEQREGSRGDSVQGDSRWNGDALGGSVPSAGDCEQPRARRERSKVLTIAGSDCSGGAGIQADLKTMTALGVYGMSVITALTAQNTTGVYGIADTAPEFVARQIDSIFTDIRPDAVKIGMVSGKDIIAVIADKLREYGAKNIVLDPVMVSTSGSRLLAEDAMEALAARLLPLAEVMTPNIPEAELLAGMRVESEREMEQAAKVIGERYGGAVLVKGGHQVETANDVLYRDGTWTWFPGDRIDNPNTHGTGCTLSSAIACGLAEGRTVEDSVRQAKAYLSGALRSGLDLGRGSGPLDHCFQIK